MNNKQKIIITLLSIISIFCLIMGLKEEKKVIPTTEVIATKQLKKITTKQFDEKENLEILYQSQMNEVLNRINNMRTSVRAKMLRRDMRLDKSTNTSCNWLADRGTTEHTSLCSYIEKNNFMGRYRGEIIAGIYTSAEATVNAWWNSESHKNVMLSDKFDIFGYSSCYYTTGQYKDKLIQIVHFGGN